jgi:hypothetical protein
MIVAGAIVGEGVWFAAGSGLALSAVPPMDHAYYAIRIPIIQTGILGFVVGVVLLRRQYRRASPR